MADWGREYMEELYQALRDAQRYVVNGISFLAQTKQFRGNKSEDLKDNFHKLLENFKKFFSEQFFINERQKDNDDSNIRSRMYANFVEGKLVLDKRWEPQHDSDVFTPHIRMDRFVSKVGNTTEENVIDALTWSLMPSMFQYMLVPSGVAMASEFFKKIFMEEKYRENGYKICRVLFATPQFLGFMKRAVAPLLKALFEERTKRELTLEADPDACADFLEDISAVCDENRAFCPGYVGSVLRSIDDAAIKEEILLQGFFIPLGENPKKYLAFDWFENIPSNFLEPIIKTLANDKGKLSRFVEFFESINPDSVMLTKEMEEMDPYLFMTPIMSQLDIMMIEQSNKKDNWVLKIPRTMPAIDMYESRIPICAVSDESCREFTGTKTCCSGTDPEVVITYFTRQLLKEAPTLPELPDEDLFLESHPVQFIRRCLVDTCDNRSLFRQRYLFSRLEELQDSWDNIGLDPSFDEWISKMSLERNQEVRMLIHEYEVLNRVKFMKIFTDSAISGVSDLLYLMLIENCDKKGYFKAFKEQYPVVEDYHLEPESFKKLFSLWLTMCETNNDIKANLFASNKKNFEKIHFRYLCHMYNINFATYRRMNPHLRTYDRMIYHYLSQGSQHQDKERPDIRRTMIPHIMKFEKLAEDTRRALEEDTDPMTKHYRLQDLIDAKLYTVFRSYCRPIDKIDVLPDPNEVYPIRMTFWDTCVMPTCFASVFGFLNDFVWVDKGGSAVENAFRQVLENMNNGEGKTPTKIPTWMLSRVMEKHDTVLFYGSQSAKTRIFTTITNLSTQMLTTITDPYIQRFSMVYESDSMDMGLILDTWVTTAATVEKCEIYRKASIIIACVEGKKEYSLSSILKLKTEGVTKHFIIFTDGFIEKLQNPMMRGTAGCTRWRFDTPPVENLSGPLKQDFREYILSLYR